MSGSIFDDISEGHDIALDFDSLRKYGIKLIQKWAGDSWTDYNIHDPGITILEALCYAITDLAYQTDFDITDLLSDQNGKIDYRGNSFFHKQAILTTNPVTVTDYRKAIIDDVDGIDNAWFSPVTSAMHVNSISGLYKIVVQIDQDIAPHWQPGSDEEKVIIDKVRTSFVGKRNLCEDVSSISVLRPVKLKIKADIQIDAIIVPEVALAQIYYALQIAINRPVKYSTERELLQQGQTIDRIYCGPRLKNGIIADADLRDRLMIIDANDLIKAISDIEGVVLVKSLQIARVGTEDYTKLLKLDETEVGFVDIDITKPFEISLVVDKYRMAIRKNLLADIYQNVTKTGNRAFVRSLQKIEELTGTYRDATAYYSVQNYFPHVYGIGNEGLVSSVSEERKAQAKQLKAYLMLFEQILANYLAQVDHVDILFSNDPDKQNRSYFSDPLYSVPRANDVLSAYTDSTYTKDDEGWMKFKANVANDYILSLNGLLEPDYIRLDRKSRMLDHLMARFNETPVVYPVTLYNMLYFSSRKTERITAEIKWKASVLKSYDDINYNRIRGFNYLVPNDLVYNFPTKMRKMLYIINDSKHPLSAVFDPGKIKFESHGDRKSAGQSSGNIVDETAWDPEMQKLTLSSKDVAELKSNKLIAEDEPKYAKSFVFANKDISVLKYAININNYRIAQESNGSYMLLFKSPTEHQWDVLSRFSSGKAPTIATLKKLTQYLIEICRQSEGFYLIEHILLRPDADIEVYGFNLYDSDNKILFENNNWLTYSSRKEIISSLLSFEPEVSFKIGRSNKLMAANNVLLLNDAQLWSGDRDKIDELIKTAEQYLKQSVGILNAANNACYNDTDNFVAGSNRDISLKNKEIASQIKNTIKQLIYIFDKKKASTSISASMNDRAKAGNDYDIAFKHYRTTIADILATANQQVRMADTHSDIINRDLLHELSKLGRLTYNSGDNYADLTRLFGNISAYGKQSYPRLKTLIKGEGNTTIDESFFSFNMSVIFPEWPARFQDIGFRACVESLFKYHTPANIKVNIKWLSVKKMRRFEPLYSTWKQNLLTNNNNYGAQHIIAFLLKENDR